MNPTRTKLVAAMTAMLALSGQLAAGCRPAATPIEWNGAQIPWETYEGGLARAKRERKPICLVFYADWCASCQEYSHVFEDRRVVERARDFVMIHVNAGERPDLDQAYKVDGRYTPRTYFLTPDGVLLKGARAPVVCSRYNYDHTDVTSLLAGMELGRKLATDPSARPDDDPLAVTTSACAPKAGDDRCAACGKAHCCAELVACVNDPACACASRQRATTQPLAACLEEHCPRCPIPK